MSFSYFAKILQDTKRNIKMLFSKDDLCGRFWLRRSATSELAPTHNEGFIMEENVQSLLFLNYDTFKDDGSNEDI